MKLSSSLVVVLSSVMGTVWIAAEPCAYTPLETKGYGKYDMVACNLCAESGKNQGLCCNAIYSHSLGRDDDDSQYGEALDGCLDIGPDECVEGQKNCYPGLFCNAGGSFPTCTLIEDDPDACIGGGCASLTRSSWTMGTSTQGGSSFVWVVVGLLGAAMLMAMTVALQRRHHRGLLRRHHYSEVDATATPRIDIWCFWWTGTYWKK